MSEPSSGVPSEIADADVETPEGDGTADEPTTVELDVDEEKLEAWDEVKGDYQVDPDGEPVPNSMDQGQPAGTDADDDAGDDDAGDDGAGDAGDDGAGDD
ncbi:hypothetical protein SAMN04489867_1901 [Pedococcus dokdonensis]|uniref:Uncharacterized protein n=1 Tax=Pedococcus dokdonensis TaxID=443156 RepID=A0A1H0RB78_9MICO|nr:hypothetical protein [Pedococcus dokdonensis]SDP26650.1 hypothetical protein SAMN04489867_1901 [Pedococcus dokdonensis]